MLQGQIYEIYLQGVPSHKKGICKTHLVGAAHIFNSQFLNLFGFSMSVSLFSVLLISDKCVNQIGQCTLGWVFALRISPLSDFGTRQL